jgi:hypothetical protein
MWPPRLIIVFFLVLLEGCGTTGPTAGDKVPQIVQPPTPANGADITAQLGSVLLPSDKALIYLYRPERYMGSANTYRIAINGTPVADMKIGTRLPYPVSPGQTTLQGRSLANILNIGLSLGLMEKPNVAFDAEQGKVYFIDVKTGFAGGPQFDFVSPVTGLEAIKGLKIADPPKQDGE